MRILLLHIVVFTAFSIVAQESKLKVISGNKHYANQNFDKAEDQYDKAMIIDENNFEAAFNLSNTYYRQEKFDKAIELLGNIEYKAESKKQKFDLYHNLGNAHAQKKEWEKSVEAYKNALRNDPSNNETRYNLSYALKKLREQQDKDQQKDQNQQDQQNKDQQKDQNKEDQQNKDQQNKDQQNDQGKQNQKDSKQGDKKEQDQKQNSQAGKMTKEEAERMLKAFLQDNKKTQEKAKKQEGVPVKGSKGKDW